MRKIKKKTAIITIFGVAAMAIIVGIILRDISNRGKMQDVYGESNLAIPKEPGIDDYKGTNRSPSEVRALIVAIESSNEVSEGEDKFIKITGITTRSQLRSDATYTVECKYNDNGYVCEVVITENNSNIRDEDTVTNSYN